MLNKQAPASHGRDSVTESRAIVCYTCHVRLVNPVLSFWFNQNAQVSKDIHSGQRWVITEGFRGAHRTGGKQMK